MANSRIDELRTNDPVLTTLAQGYTNSMFIADKLLPIVSVSKLKGKIPIFGKNAFIMRDTNRAIRSDSNRIPPADIELVEFETREQDIETALDYLEEEEALDFWRLEHRIAKELMDILNLGMEKSAADLVQNLNSYSSDQRKDVQSEEAWDNAESEANPLEDIRNGMNAIRTKIGRYPNVMIIGDSAMQTLLRHGSVTEKVKYAGLAVVDTAVISELINIKNIFVGTSVYSDDGSTFTDVWQDNIILAYVDQSERDARTEYNPSFGYIIRREGKPEIDTYYENGGKIKVVRCTDNYVVKLTAADAGYLIHNVNHTV